MQKRRRKKYLYTLMTNTVFAEEKYTCNRRSAVRMEQQQFSKVEMDNVVAPSNILEVDESVASSNNLEAEELVVNQVVAIFEQES